MARSYRGGGKRRLLSWSAAMRDMREARQVDTGVREEAMRGGSGELTIWRGRSGRRYVFSVMALTEEAAATQAAAVLLAVERNGVGQILDAAEAGDTPDLARRALWVEKMLELGGTELHVHSLAPDHPARRAVVTDLKQGSAEAEDNREGS